MHPEAMRLGERARGTRGRSTRTNANECTLYSCFSELADGPSGLSEVEEQEDCHGTWEPIARYATDSTYEQHARFT